MTGMPESLLLSHPALSDPHGRLGAGYNRRHLFFRHELAACPLFALDSLGALTRRIPDHSGEAYWSNGPVDAADGWHRGARQLPLQHTMGRIERNDSLIILSQVQRDPLFAPLLHELLSTLITCCGGRLASDVVSAEASIVIASPGRITPYHLDSEPHFLLQVLGEQDLSVFDATDRSLVSERDMEGHHVRNGNSLHYAPGRQSEAGTYYQHANRGVHIPSHAPHWARSRDSVSVTVRLSFRLRSVLCSGRVRRVNHWLRRHGLRPIPPGACPWIDQLKLSSHETLDALRDLARRGRDAMYPQRLDALRDRAGLAGQR